MNPNVLRTIATLLFSSSFLGFAIGSVQANTVNISGATPGFPGYGTSVSKHNVINSGTSGVTGADLSTFKGSVAGNPAVVTTDLPLYNVDWYFAGSESGFVNTLIAPGINPLGTLPNSAVVGQFNEHDQNNNCSSSCPPHGPNPGPLFLGTSFAQTSSILNFTLTDDHGDSVTNGSSNPNPGTNGVPSIVFSYLSQTGSLSWALSSDTTSAWFLFAFNDKGGPDSDHDDIVGVARVYCATPNGAACAPPPPVPLPAALPLFATGAGVIGLLGWRRKRKPVASIPA